MPPARAEHERRRLRPPQGTLSSRPHKSGAEKSDGAETVALSEPRQPTVPHSFYV